MLLYEILKQLIETLNMIFAYMPFGDTLPTIAGVNLDNIFQDGINYVKLLAQIFPPLITIMICASIYLTWRLGLLGLKVALGNRSPAHK